MRLLRNKSLPVWLGGLGLCTLLWSVLSVFGAAPTGTQLGRLNTLVFDTYQTAKPRTWGGSDVVIVDIDEPSLRALGQWPWPRTELARLTTRLGELGAAVIVFDMVFSESDRTSPARSMERLSAAGIPVEVPQTLDPAALDHDRVFAVTIQAQRVVTGMVLSAQGVEPPKPKAGTGVSGTLPARLNKKALKAVRNLPLLDEAATGIGDFSFPTDDHTDAVVRSSTVLRPANGLFYPSLASEALRVAQGAGSFKIKMADGSGEWSGGNNAVVSVQVGALEIPTNAEGDLTIYHSPRGAKPVLSAHHLLDSSLSASEMEALKQAIEGHIVLVGTSAAGLLDLRATPLESVVPGVSVHADIIDQMIAGPFLNRPDWIKGLEIALALVGVLLILLSLPFLGALTGGLLAVVLVAAFVSGFWHLFTLEHLIGSPLLPTFYVLAAYVGGTAGNLLITERQRRRVRAAFGRYLAPAMVDRLAIAPEALKLGGEDRELTLLFCDIRGFTSLSEGLAPTELTNLLNRFLTPMTTALLERGATIDKYMGDAIMAFWNAPLDQEDHRQRACEGLLDMRAALQKLNAGLERPIKVGIGLNTGLCCVGNLGSSQRFSYSAIGDAVNVASRIEGQTKLYGLDNLLAEETLIGITGFVCLEVDRLQVIGRDEPLTVWTLLGRDSEFAGAEFAPLFTHHQAVLSAFKAGDAAAGLREVEKASRTAHALRLEHPAVPELDDLYRLYRARFDGFRCDGVPEAWDGVYRATKK